MTGQPLKHGTPSAYRRHKCRCDACVAAARAYDLDYWRRRGRQPKGNPCEAEGTTFPTQREAARALCVSKSAITAALNRHGDLSRIGRGRGHSRGGQKRPVKIGAHEWPSRKALADWIGMSADTVRGWLRRGDMERLVAAVMQEDARRARVAAHAAAMERRAA